ncbi:MAG: branched-chain amino acid ABC transporter substrate-binding protein [Chloroflexi bacterium]|nr:branched-chain amino acid ABC transporter substrate-binding protein [Chloroflexota bacterium]
MKSLYALLFLMLVSPGFGAATSASDGCADELGCVEIAPDEKIVFGGILRLSGPRPWTGLDTQNAFQLAVLARDGVLLGREIELLLEDSACSEEAGREAAKRMVANPSIVGIIGTNCSLAAKGALPIISEAGLLMISPSNSSPFLTNADRNAGGLYQPGYFRTAHNDLFQGALSARFAVSALGVDSVATIDDGDPYTRGLAKAMADVFASLNGEVVFQGVISKGATDMSGILGTIAESGAELLYFPVFVPEAIVIAEQIADAPELENTIMMTAGGAFSTAIARGAGEAAIGIYVGGPYIAGEAYEAFVETWRREIDEGGPATGFSSHSYDASNLLFEAVEAVARERDDGTLVIGRAALRDALAAVEDYPGLTGSLTCQDESPYAGDCASGRALAIYQLTAAEARGGNWPPPVVWTAAMLDEE